jgi:hypothetical protein
VQTFLAYQVLGRTFEENVRFLDLMDVQRRASARHGLGYKDRNTVEPVLGSSENTNELTGRSVDVRQCFEPKHVPSRVRSHGRRMSEEVFSHSATPSEHHP